jgi:hypothetical protein
MLNFGSHIGVTMQGTIPEISCGDWQAVVFKHERMYQHKIMRVNYTTYDVRRGEDVIHTGTSHCDIMVLNPLFSENPQEHPFWYARVLSIYHANVIYIGEGNTDYHPCRLEFLWVRWFELENIPAGWKKKRLDRIHFPSLFDDDAFGFVDPRQVLRSCHLIPMFSQKRVHVKDDIGISHLGQSSEDWRSYTVNRYVSSLFPRSSEHKPFSLAVLSTVI